MTNRKPYPLGRARNDTIGEERVDDLKSKAKMTPSLRGVLDSRVASWLGAHLRLLNSAIVAYEVELPPGEPIHGNIAKECMGPKEGYLDRTILYEM